jgi:aspartyl-tRNA(Asn)/glutamyl-tRNA(Gln) amidotransferase subunit A
MTIHEFGLKLRAREITSTDVVEACLRRIDADNPRLNAFIAITEDEARRQARQADRELADGHDRGPLHGVPISIKDIIDMRGLPTTAASRVREGHVAERDAPTIVNLRQAGAVFVGKTNLHGPTFTNSRSEPRAKNRRSGQPGTRTIHRARRAARAAGRQSASLPAWRSPRLEAIPADPSASPPPHAASSA